MASKTITSVVFFIRCFFLIWSKNQFKCDCPGLRPGRYRVLKGIHNLLWTALFPSQPPFQPHHPPIRLLDPLRLDFTFFHRLQHDSLKLIGYLLIISQVVAKAEDVHPRIDAQHDGLLQAVFAGDGLHLHIVGEDDAVVANFLLINLARNQPKLTEQTFFWLWRINLSAKIYIFIFKLADYA